MESTDPKYIQLVGFYGDDFYVCAIPCMRYKKPSNAVMYVEKKNFPQEFIDKAERGLSFWAKCDYNWDEDPSSNTTTIYDVEMPTQTASEQLKERLESRNGSTLEFDL